MASYVEKEIDREVIGISGIPSPYGRSGDYSIRYCTCDYLHVL